MLSNFSQYSPLGLLPPQGAGWLQMNPGLFGQPGANSGNASFGNALFAHEPGQAALSPQLPFGFGGQTNAFAQNPLPGTFAGQPAIHNLQHIMAVLGQLAQQLSVHNAMTQQIGIALHQIVQQLLVQSSAGGGYGQGGYGQGGYGGFNPQAAQAWGANRPQTIQ